MKIDVVLYGKKFEVDVETSTETLKRVLFGKEDFTGFFRESGLEKEVIEILENQIIEENERQLRELQV